MVSKMSQPLIYQRVRRCANLLWFDLGFVYFQFPKGSPVSGLWTLHLEAQDLTTKQIKSFDLAF
jgi:hypothetical protein